MSMDTIRYFLAGLVAVALVGCGSTELKNQAKAAVSANLRDPESVQFRNLTVGKTKANGAAYVCGEYNAKNGFGGYAGYERFMWDEFGVTTESKLAASLGTKEKGRDMMTAYCNDDAALAKKAMSP
jgi:hypothetical protein